MSEPKRVWDQDVPRSEPYSQAELEEFRRELQEAYDDIEAGHGISIEELERQLEAEFPFLRKRGSR
jgi:hypothetical protein